MDEKHAREAGDILCRQASADAKTLGPGSISQANRQRAQWGLTIGGDLFPSSAAVPTVRDLGAFVVALDLDMPSYSERVARYASGPIAELLALAEGVKARRPRKRGPGYLSAARAHTWEPPADLGEGVLEALEAERFDDPRSALKSTREALKTASGPIAVGRVLAIHASNLREVDELAEALLALRVAIPALDLAGDRWGMGRALMTAAAVTRALGRFKLARSLVDHAEAWYLHAGSMEGRGTTLAFRGVLALNAGEPHKAMRELDAALTLYPSANRIYVASAHQVRALAFVRCKELGRAREAIARALAYAPNARVLRGRIVWHAADIENADGDHAAAETLYAQAFELVAEPLCDRLLVAAKAVRAAIRQGETARALTRATSLLEPMFARLTATNPDPTRRVLEAAHRDLYRAVLEAGLSIAVVDKAIGRIEAARTARTKRLRRPFIQLSVTASDP